MRITAPETAFPKIGKANSGRRRATKVLSKSVNTATDPSPNLSPARGEALKPPFPCREGG
ncbi:hypothetical protein FJR06_00955 [Dolichospermum sp. UHCC 0352]|nr:hypothetical protein [Dolichospermum sp. UHCC 0299]MTJ19979.1 hypothetical protein [Dolichospermum sp. UHCC 0352]